jgi:hypothetical protein
VRRQQSTRHGVRTSSLHHARHLRPSTLSALPALPATVRHCAAAISLKRPLARAATRLHERPRGGAHSTLVMADSVDRVFSHALNTVNKIRTGSQKPPSATRLRLYGLYKQAMGTYARQGATERAQAHGLMQRQRATSTASWTAPTAAASRTSAQRRSGTSQSAQPKPQPRPQGAMSP